MLGRLLKWVLKLILITVFVVVVTSIVGGLWLQYRFQDPAWVTISRIIRPELDWQSPRYPSLNWAFKIAYKMLADDARLVYGYRLGSQQKLDPKRLAFGVVGPEMNGHNGPFYYDKEGRPLSEAEVEAGVLPAHIADPGVADKIVNSLPELEQALETAIPGDHILILPGVYSIRGRALKLKQGGRLDAPIFVRGASFGDVILKFDMLEGFLVSAPYWVFENLVIRGTCKSDNNCEHAFHIVGRAENTTIRNVMAVNFNAAVKVNRLGEDVPDYGLIENGFFANEWARKTTRPVTPLDIVAANGWRVASNVIADFAKAKGNGISYGGFFKGGGSGGIFERNLLMCEWLHYGGVRIGLSFGGGGTYSPSACRDGVCGKEHSNGIIRNNVIMNCPNDVGIYVNHSPNSLIHNNVLTATSGIDVRYKESSALIQNNVIDGRIYARDGGTYEAMSNVISLWRAMTLSPVSTTVYRAPEQADFTPISPANLNKGGTAVAQPYLDFCGAIGSLMAPDLGAFKIESPFYCNNLQSGRR
ncbi:MAG: right-handed parallel beta-helix repeat-containing protein [Sphingomonadales bacterium]|jgi:hypothetical protein